MISIIGFLLGFTVGIFMGMLLTCCVVIGRRKEDKNE